MLKTTLILGVAFLLVSCASSGKKFAKIYPGMTVEQVGTVMETGPSQVQTLSDGYASWYYGEDRCLLMKDEKVISKDQSKDDGGIEIFGIGGARQRRLAECVAPGQERTKKIERSIETPWGTMKK